MLELLQSNSLGLPLVAGGSLLVVCLLLLLWWRNRKRFQSTIDRQRQDIRHFEKEVQKANNQLLEVRSVVVGLGQKVSEQQDIIQHLHERVTELEHTDSDSRLYSRASKMVQLGADLNELIEECELPKAEAELMMSLQNKLAGKEKVPPLSGASGQASKARAGEQRKRRAGTKR
jgi:predicted RNase H-like nuclease (RuvC/YqgF family)